VERRRSILFLVSFLIATIAVSLVGWFTDIRGVMHSVLIGLFVTAFFPFVFVATVTCVVVGFVLFLAVLSLFGVGDGAGDVADAGTDLVYSSVRLSRWGAPRYYAILMSVRHPAIWGSVVGLLAGGLLLWGLVSWIIVPRELVTSRVLAEAADQLMRTQRQTGRFPVPRRLYQPSRYRSGRRRTGFGCLRAPNPIHSLRSEPVRFLHVEVGRL
jgi:MFS family permease